MNSVLQIFVTIGLLLTSTQSTNYLSAETNINGFISESRSTLQSLGRKCPKYSLKQYNITDTLNVQQRQIQLTRYIKTRTLLQHFQIFASESGLMEDSSFLIAIYYNTKTTPYLTANIFDIRTINRIALSGTDIMLLCHHILIGIGVKTCSLINCSKLRYETESESRVIPLIYLRCIRGKTSDWYSDLGYSNQNEDKIATEMKRIHDTPYRNTTFGA